MTLSSAAFLGVFAGISIALHGCSGGSPTTTTAPTTTTTTAKPSVSLVVPLSSFDLLPKGPPEWETYLTDMSDVPISIWLSGDAAKSPDCGKAIQDVGTAFFRDIKNGKLDRNALDDESKMMKYINMTDVSFISCALAVLGSPSSSFGAAIEVTMKKTGANVDTSQECVVPVPPKSKPEMNNIPFAVPGYGAKTANVNIQDFTVKGLKNEGCKEVKQFVESSAEDAPATSSLLDGVKKGWFDAMSVRTQVTVQLSQEQQQAFLA